MAKVAKILCEHCETRTRLGVAFCEACGHPTDWASAEDRTTWEVGQWRAVRNAGGLSVSETRRPPDPVAFVMPGQEASRPAFRAALRRLLELIAGGAHEDDEPHVLDLRDPKPALTIVQDEPSGREPV
jgi:hypothetical protein